MHGRSKNYVHGCFSVLYMVASRKSPTEYFVRVSSNDDGWWHNYTAKLALMAGTRIMYVNGMTAHHTVCSEAGVAVGVCVRYNSLSLPSSSSLSLSCIAGGGGVGGASSGADSSPSSNTTTSASTELPAVPMSSTLKLSSFSPPWSSSSPTSTGSGMSSTPPSTVPLSTLSSSSRSANAISTSNTCRREVCSCAVRLFTSSSLVAICASSAWMRCFAKSSSSRRSSGPAAAAVFAASACCASASCARSCISRACDSVSCLSSTDPTASEAALCVCVLGSDAGPPVFCTAARYCVAPCRPAKKQNLYWSRVCTMKRLDRRMWRT
eukprot:m.336804 g.336804  ORF g.336804 m.336804 type:complete len:323 (-) comp20542_c0_seq2:1857-2825(-)